MNSFTSFLTINNELYCFCFSEIALVDSSKYYVAVKQEDQRVTAFEMKKDAYNGYWVVCQPAPKWILEQGATLAKLLAENEASSTPPAN